MIDNLRRSLARLVFGDNLLTREDSDRQVEERLKLLAAEGEQWRGIEDRLADDFDENWPTGSAPIAAEGRRPGPSTVAETETWGDLADEDRGWKSTTQGIYEVNAGKLKVAQNQCQYLFARHPLARNIVRNYLFLTAGSGVQLKFPRRQKVWDAWAVENDWEAAHKGIILNTYLLGEWPVVTYPLTDTQVENETAADRARREEVSRPKPGAGKGNATLRDKVRGFDPRYIDKVQTEGEDYATIKYVQRTLADGRVFKFGPGDLTYFRANRTGSGVRGRPTLEPVLIYLRWIHAFLQDRVVMNAYRTRLPIIRKMANISGTTAVANESARLNRVPRPGTIVTVGAGEDWTFPSLNAGGGDAAPDAQLLLRMVAAGVNLPEFLVTSNAETANRSSLEEAVDSMKPMFEEYRAMFGDGFCDIAERIVGVRPEAVWPTGERRESRDQIQAYSLAVDQRLMSRQTAATKLGLNWSEELAKLADEQTQLEAAGLEPGGAPADHIPGFGPADAPVTTDIEPEGESEEENEPDEPDEKPGE